MKILIYYDERLYGEALSSMLVRRGHDVVACATTITDLVDLAQSRSANVCLIGLQSPVQNDIPAVEELRRVVPMLPLVVLSSDFRVGSTSNSAAAGADGLCLKIDSIEEIERVLSGSITHHSVANRSAPIRSQSVASLSKKRSTSSKDASITPKEQAVLELLVHGATTATIASNLGVGEATIRTHLQHLFTKFDVHSRLALVASAIRAHAVKADEFGSLPRFE